MAKTSPAPSTPYDRLRWQQANCTEDVIGYAVVLASDVTERVAYMTGTGTELTNDEALAAILTKPEASALMSRLYESNSLLGRDQDKIAFLVPVSKEMPLSSCTSTGY